jgi:hypothetical protein
MRRYVHIGTGNYNPSTARLYTDLGLVTCRDDIAEDDIMAGVTLHDAAEADDGGVFAADGGGPRECGQLKGARGVDDGQSRVVFPHAADVFLDSAFKELVGDGCGVAADDDSDSRNV